MFDLDQLKKAEMFAHTLAQKLEKLRQQVENGAPSPHMVKGELDSAEQITEHVQNALKKVD
jgi:hypothetical protein